MAAAKRKSRRREHDSPEADLPESPSKQSSKRRKKSNGLQTAKSKEEDPPPDSDASLEDTSLLDNRPIEERVISCLTAAPFPVAVVTEHANAKINEQSKVSAYAKIAGRDWTFFVMGQTVNLGRHPDKDADNAPAASPGSEPKDFPQVHIDLGPSKFVSRHHASIFYDAEMPVGGGWHLKIIGRNGIRVNNALRRGAETILLASGDVLEVSSTQMMFVLPTGKIKIDRPFLEQANIVEGEEWPTTHAHPPQPAPPQRSSVNQPLAPAPPQAKDAVTPPRQQPVGPSTSPAYNRGMVMETTSEIDYSLDAAKDLKPPFSYATMIAQAIFSNDEEMLTLANIYAWISDKYAFYRHSNSAWQNSIRHNLSLNKAFHKVPRRTDEPGKGMKWQITPEYRQEYLKKQAKKGISSSSAPTSPAPTGVARDVPQNFRGANGQNLGYDSSYTSQFLAVNSDSKAKTPERRRKSTLPETDTDMLDSPLPHRLANPPTYVLPTPHQPQLSHPSPAREAGAHAHDNPTLSSSYLSPYHSSSTLNTQPANIQTPAPRKQSVRLAPPSTLVAPSKFMPPDSSPAGTASFWKGAMSSMSGIGYNSTPFRPLDGSSPLKHDRDSSRHLLSSSPPPMGGLSDMSPSKRAPDRQIRTNSNLNIGTAPLLRRRSSDEQINGGRGPSPPSAGSGNGGAPMYDTLPPFRHHHHGVNIRREPEPERIALPPPPEDEPEMLGGFDLARGFQPIGGRTAQAQK